MAEKLIDIAFSGFWGFVGVSLLLSGFMALTLTFILKMWSRFMRMIMVRKHGWPPQYLDADGDWKPIIKMTKEEIIESFREK
jgi:hypothetical protein